MAIDLSPSAVLDPDALAAFRAAFRGALVGPDDPAYDAARRVHNGRIDRRPALVARAANVADVIRAVRFGRSHGLRLAVRGGGHHGAGFGTTDGGLVIDLGALDGIRVDPAGRTARIEGGARLGDVDHATHPFGLATPAGIISTTGIGGLALGGGVGHLTRKLGLTVDSILEVDVVLADGSFVTASEQRHPDLFWAIRGGGGNFGVVTSFLVRLHAVGTVFAGPTLYDLDQAAEVMAWYRDFIGQAPEDLGGFFALLTVPPIAPFPEHLHLRKMAAIVWCYAGDQDRAEAVFEPVRAFGPPAFDGVHSVPLPALQRAFDGLYPPGVRLAWRGAFVQDITDEAIAEHVRFGPTLPSIPSTMHLYPIDGAAHRVASGDTAFGHRTARWAMTIVGAGSEPADDAPIRAWTDAYWGAVRPHVASGGYVNFFENEGHDRVRAAYGSNYPRLTRIKAHYDPDNTFSLNQNIVPA